MAILERHDSNGIATLHLNAPERLNALSDEMLAALKAEIDRLHKDTDTRVVVIAGRGKAFCAGHDLREMTAGRQAEDGGAAYFADLFSRCTEVMLGLQQIPSPLSPRSTGSQPPLVASWSPPAIWRWLQRARALA